MSSNAKPSSDPIPYEATTTGKEENFIELELTPMVTAPIPVIKPQTPANPQIASARTETGLARTETVPARTEIAPANPASVREKSFSNRPTGRVSVGEARRNLAQYRTNVKDKPKEYVGKRRAKETAEVAPTVFLAIETVDGLGDSVIGASLDYGLAVELVQKFAGRLGEGEVFPDNHTSMTLAGQRLRTAEGNLSPYKIFPVVLDR